METSIKNDRDEERLRDALYSLQMVHEVSGKAPEPAVIPHSEMPLFEDDCEVFIDDNTKTRIVMTPLPADEAEYTGAKVWLSNTIEGVELDDYHLWPNDVVYWIAKAGVKRFVPDSGEQIDIDAVDLAKKLTIPKIKPYPQSEEDSRAIPTSIETLQIPETDAYTLASGIFDNELLNSALLKAKRAGIIQYNLDAFTTFDMELTEILPAFFQKKEDDVFNLEVIRTDEFDRQFEIFIKLGDTIHVPMIPWGGEKIQPKVKNLLVKVMREGILFKMRHKDGVMTCIPTENSKLFIERILHSSEKLN